MQEPAEGQSNLFTVPSLYRAARLVGDAVREVRRVDGAALEDTNSGFNATFILGGQVGSETARLFMIYPEGNFIEATDDTPFFQIGERCSNRAASVRIVPPIEP
jgi:putative proteasome-type protease